MIVLLGVFFIVLLIISRQRQNQLFLHQQILKQSFEKQLLQSQIEVQETTYNALSIELHDNVCQLLGTAKIMLNMLEKQSKHPSEMLTSSAQTVGDAIQEIRTLSKSLSKEWLTQFNLVENLVTEIKRINAAKKVMVHFNEGEKLHILSNRQIVLFRIIQEALHNAIKHGAPNHIHIDISTTNPSLIIAIKDDGKGFDTNKKTEGLGRLNMLQRVNLLNGNIAWQSPGKGCIVKLTIPLLAEEM